MPADTSIPCSFEARDRARGRKGESQSWDEFLKEMFAHEHEHELETEVY